jgi:hypothetical protein
MSILAIGGVLPLLLILACPLMMVLMMFGMHGHGHGGHGHAGRQAPPDEAQAPRQRMTLEELKRERDELNALIGDRAEQAADREAAI